MRMPGAEKESLTKRGAGWWTPRVTLGLGLALWTGCVVGPRYTRPAAVIPPTYKEGAPAAQAVTQNLQREWWRIFGDPQLDALESQIAVSNQNLKAAEAQFRQARALVQFNRADYYPTVTAGAAITESHISQNRPPHSASDGATFTDLFLPVDMSYEIDAWGRVRNLVEASRADAQASAADVATVNLSLQAELASDYFQLRSLDAEKKLLDDSVGSFEQALRLTENRYRGGIASNVDVAQAETQLETTRAQDIDVGVQRAQFEHAIAVLVERPASSFSIPFSPLVAPPPAIPPGVPSQLLERRPDIAASERRIAAVNAQIGVAQAAYLPQLTLTAAGGFESGTFGTLLQGPGGFWTVGVGALETVFDAGRRRAAVEGVQASYDQTVDFYRQDVLAAFQEVEDNLAALRILAEEAKTEETAVQAAQRSLSLSTTRYRGGVTSYLEVLTAQNAALVDERTAVSILGRRLNASVLLIKALGGGWDAATGIPQAESMAVNAGRSGQ
jgi:NodT family efflux transporter outer membrane factor (OMF) lipoprotein